MAHTTRGTGLGKCIITRNSSIHLIDPSSDTHPISFPKPSTQTLSHHIMYKSNPTPPIPVLNQLIPHKSHPRKPLRSRHRTRPGRNNLHNRLSSQPTTANTPRSQLQRWRRLSLPCSFASHTQIRTPGYQESRAPEINSVRLRSDALPLRHDGLAIIRVVEISYRALGGFGRAAVSSYEAVVGEA